VNNARDMVYAVPDERPTYLGADLRSLVAEAETLTIAAHPAWKTDVGAGAVTVTATGEKPGADGLSIVRAVARTLWDSGDRQLTLQAGDEIARSALQRWSLLTDPD
jgi:hypothetical protein